MDYKKTGLLGGLEIHQQLEGSKLFCSCPAFLRKDAPDYTIMRKLHRVAGEGGEVDAAVEYESSLDREFNYQGYDDTTCLIELDEEPPKEINEPALDEVIKIALLMNCKIYSVSQIMRKTVIDGSNTSGFQRTVLIAHDGWIETSFGKVSIDSIALEEDAARIISKSKKQFTYRLDRMGIPLVEITTSPTMKTPEEIKEAALKIGEIIRACKVKRGIGTIRQDVNISIRGHEKVEIKGFQNPSKMIKTIELEVKRQEDDLRAKKKTGEVRNALASGESEFLRPLPGKARMYPETDLPLLKIKRDRLNSLKKNLPKLKAQLRDELKKKGLSDELIGLVLNGNLDEFEMLLKVHDKDANLVAKMVSLWRSELSTKLKISLEDVKDKLDERMLESILESLEDGEIGKRDVKSVMERIAGGENLGDAIKIDKISDDVLEEEIRKLIKKKPGLRANAYMGLIMKRFKGNVDAKCAMKIIKKFE